MLLPNPEPPQRHYVSLYPPQSQYVPQIPPAQYTAPPQPQRERITTVREHTSLRSVVPLCEQWNRPTQPYVIQPQGQMDNSFRPDFLPPHGGQTVTSTPSPNFNQHTDTIQKTISALTNLLIFHGQGQR